MPTLGKRNSLPVYLKLRPGCFCFKSNGRYISILTREMPQCYLTQSPHEKCWQIYKLSIAQWWEAPTIFRTAQVSEMCHAETKRIEPGDESTWGKRASMTHPVQPPDTTLQSSISASYPVRSQLDEEAVAGATQCSSGDWVTEVKGSASNNANPGICYLQIANSSFPNITVCALASLMSSLS